MDKTLSDKNEPKHGVWFGGLNARKSQERTNEVYGYRVHLEEDKSVRSMKLYRYVHIIRHGNKRGGGCAGFTITGDHS